MYNIYNIYIYIVCRSSYHADDTLHLVCHILVHKVIEIINRRQKTVLIPVNLIKISTQKTTAVKLKDKCICRVTNDNLKNSL